jgi:hypothetical protein
MGTSGWDSPAASGAAFLVLVAFFTAFFLAAVFLRVFFLAAGTSHSSSLVGARNHRTPRFYRLCRHARVQFVLNRLSISRGSTRRLGVLLTRLEAPVAPPLRGRCHTWREASPDGLRRMRWGPERCPSGAVSSSGARRRWHAESVAAVAPFRARPRGLATQVAIYLSRRRLAYAQIRWITYRFRNDGGPSSGMCRRRTA